MMGKRFWLACWAVISFGSAAGAADIAVIFDKGERFDKSFNEATYLGVLRARTELGADIIEIERPKTLSEEDALNLAADQAAMVIAIDYRFVGPLARVAAARADTRFTGIDFTLDGQNIRSISFREHEGAFLVGALAAMASQTGVVGFVGGVDIDVIRKFEAGYRQGVRHSRPDVTVISSVLSTGQTGFRDPYLGYVGASGLLAKGADVVFAAAGVSGLGVYQAAADQGALAVGVDSNQNYLHPGSMLTSMLKRVDNAVYSAIDDWINGRWEPGRISLGVREGGVGYAYDRYNRSLLTQAMVDELDRLEDGIAAGRISVSATFTGP